MGLIKFIEKRLGMCFHTWTEPQESWKPLAMKRYCTKCGRREIRFLTLTDKELCEVPDLRPSDILRTPSGGYIPTSKYF